MMTKKKLTPEEIKDIEERLEGFDLDETLDVLKDLEEVLMNMTKDLEEPKAPAMHSIPGNATIH